MKSYKELIVWQRSIELVKEIFLLTARFPKSELYGLISQMRRASVAISSNIAEGYGRKSEKEYGQFFSIAYGSALELETQLIISKQLDMSTVDDFIKSEKLLVEVLKMLNVMTSKYRHSNS
ncbi:four helix bundle protein [Candidatus Microgenomates bacterium]|nr:four helix bundle protein [Candidatus Microgenomates bacterium]